MITTNLQRIPTLAESCMRVVLQSPSESLRGWQVAEDKPLEEIILDTEWASFSKLPDLSLLVENCLTLRLFSPRDLKHLDILKQLYCVRFDENFGRTLATWVLSVHQRDRNPHLTQAPDTLPYSCLRGIDLTGIRSVQLGGGTLRYLIEHCPKLEKLSFGNNYLKATDFEQNISFFAQLRVLKLGVRYRKIVEQDENRWNTWLLGGQFDELSLTYERITFPLTFKVKQLSLRRCECVIDRRTEVKVAAKWLELWHPLRIQSPDRPNPLIPRIRSSRTLYEDRPIVYAEWGELLSSISKTTQLKLAVSTSELAEEETLDFLELLTTFPRLQGLELSFSESASVISQLGKLTQLMELNLSYLGVGDLDLTPLTRLQRLTLPAKLITSKSRVQVPYGLQTVQLRGNGARLKPKDLLPIARCMQLDSKRVVWLPKTNTLYGNEFFIPANRMARLAKEVAEKFVVRAALPTEPQRGDKRLSAESEQPGSNRPLKQVRTNAQSVVGACYASGFERINTVGSEEESRWLGTGKQEACVIHT